MKKEDLKEYLSRNCQGRGKAIGGERLRQSIHTSENELRKVVNRLRREGVPIASDKTGYYYAQTAGEVYTTIRNLKKCGLAWTLPSWDWSGRWSSSAVCVLGFAREQLYSLGRWKKGAAGGNCQAVSTLLRAIYRGLWWWRLGALP